MDSVIHCLLSHHKGSPFTNLPRKNEEQMKRLASGLAKGMLYYDDDMLSMNFLKVKLKKTGLLIKGI